MITGKLETIRSAYNHITHCLCLCILSFEMRRKETWLTKFLLRWPDAMHFCLQFAVWFVMSKKQNVEVYQNSEQTWVKLIVNWIRVKVSECKLHRRQTFQCHFTVLIKTSNHIIYMFEIKVLKAFKLNTTVRSPRLFHILKWPWSISIFS